MKTLIVGLGNPILGDDRVGLEVANRLKKMIGETENIDILEFSGSAIHLAETLLGYDRVIIIDCVNEKAITGNDKILHIKYRDIKNTDLRLIEPHDADVFSALKLMESAFQEEFPKQIDIIGIRCSFIDFSEKETPATKQLIDKSIQIILLLLEGDMNEN